MRAQGGIRVSDDRYEIDGLGLRDHSWGPRYWQNIYWYRWLPLNFTEDFAMVLSIIAERDGTRHIGGMVLEGDTYHPIREATLNSHYDERQQAIAQTFTVTTDERTYEVEGQALSRIPLRNRRKDDSGEEMLTRITEAMTEFRCGDHVGYGMAEYLDQMVDGEPVGE
jgi:predicted secreted hydrolase